jgi:UDP-galactopyranose mutase
MEYQLGFWKKPKTRYMMLLFFYLSLVHHELTYRFSHTILVSFLVFSFEIDKVFNFVWGILSWRDMSVTVRVRKKSLILRNVVDAVAEANGKRTKEIDSTYSLISEWVAFTFTVMSRTKFKV